MFAMMFKADDRAWLEDNVPVIVREVDYSLASAYVFNTSSGSMYWISVYALTHREL
jgi:hypothetical protein